MNLQRDLLDAVGGQLTGVPQLLGPEHLTSGVGPPRIVWVPTRDRFGPPTGDDPDRAKRPLMGVRSGFDLYLWARDMDEARELRRRLVVALCGLATWAWELGTGTWAETELGRVYILEFALHETITADAVRVVTVADAGLAPSEPEPDTRQITFGGT